MKEADNQAQQSRRLQQQSRRRGAHSNLAKSPSTYRVLRGHPWVLTELYSTIALRWHCQTCYTTPINPGRDLISQSPFFCTSLSWSTHLQAASQSTGTFQVTKIHTKTICISSDSEAKKRLSHPERHYVSQGSPLLHPPPTQRSRAVV